MHLTTEETRELSVNKVTDTILPKLKIMNCEDFYVYMIDTNFNKFVRNPGHGSQGWIPSPSQGSVVKFWARKAWQVNYSETNIGC
ncbi:hypothetical protein FOBRF1_002792 [Fusarium oxysporum]